MFNQYLERFPITLKKVLKDTEIDCSEIKLYNYKDGIKVYRVFDNDYTVEQNFFSQVELVDLGLKKPRDFKNFSYDNIGSYSTSFNTNDKPLRNIFRFPRDDKTLVSGLLKNTHGLTSECGNSGHLHLFRFDDSDDLYKCFGECK